MRISRAGDYGLRAIVYLSEQREGKVCTISEIAAARHIPKAFLAKLMPLLIRADMVRSAQGPKGGYRLARKPENITFLEALEAIDGPIALAHCLDSRHDCCPMNNCTMNEVWSRAQKVLIDFLRRTTFADLARAGRSQMP